MGIDTWNDSGTDQWINFGTDEWLPLSSTGAFSNELENKMLDHIFNGTYTAPDTYIGLSTSNILGFSPLGKS